MARLLKAANYYLHGCLLPFEAEVEVGLILEHYALGVVIHPQVKIGKNCRIYHHVTFASETWIGSPFYINLENDVTIGAHSVVVARSNCSLTIGKGACVGAGAVLTRDVPAGEIWAGNPARKIGEVAGRAQRLGLS